MSRRTDIFDLAALRLTAGEGRRLDLETGLDGLELGGEPYVVEPADVPVVLDISRMTGGGYAMRLRFEAAVSGPCMRCLNAAAPSFGVDVREVDQPGEDDDLNSPYVDDDKLDVKAWAGDALSLALPAQLLCREDCAGLCPECGIDLNEAGPEHRHERAPDSRWEKLSELRFE